jgi:tRNA nucleotidyltransferase (CCA-adding enzyme)
VLGSRPAKALRIARDTGVLVALIPEFGRAIDYDQQSERQDRTLDEHVFATVQYAADARSSLAVRLSALFHDLGKPESDETGESHARIGTRIAGEVLSRLRYPGRLRRYVMDLVAAHAFRLDDVDELFARRLLRKHGDELARDLVEHKRADLRAKAPEPWELPAIDAMEQALEREARQPHRIGDLAIDGDDLLSLGFAEGPALGRALAQLLDEVLEEPERNTPDWLRERAKELVPA